MLLFDEQNAQMLEEFNNAISKIRRKKKKVNLLEEMKNKIKKIDIAREFYEEFTEDQFIVKTRVDSMYLNKLFESLPDEYAEDFKTMLTETLRTVKLIYELTNLKPEIYGKGVNEEILNESIMEADKLIKKNIYDFLDRKFYRLSLNERKEKYFERVSPYVQQLIQEGTDPEEATIHAVKTCVLEELLTNVFFPKIVYNRIKHLSEDSTYSAAFDVDYLKENIDKFEKCVYSLAKIASVIV
jgi:uncharacterized protein YihD (DUF1040 family)